MFVSHYSSSGSDSDDSGEVLNASANPYDMSVMKSVAVFRYVKRYFVLTTLHSHEGCGLEAGGDFIFFHGKDEHVAIIRIISEESDFILSELASEPPFEVPHLTTITKHFGLGFLLYVSLDCCLDCFIKFRDFLKIRLTWKTSILYIHNVLRAE